MRIAIVNDVIPAVEAMRRVIASDPKHRLAWIGRNGKEAVEHCARDLPDLILMDLIMPVMDGVEATRRIMAETPCAILIVTATVNGHAGKVFEALGAGALDAVDTPLLSASGVDAGAAPLLVKIDLLGKLIGPAEKATSAAPLSAKGSLPQARKLVAIGSSAGGPAALAGLLRDLPRDFPAAVIIVQHVDERFAAGLADWLGQHSALPVHLAREGDRPVISQVLLAGTDDHLIFTSAETLGYSPHPREYAYRPSVDVFFESLAKHWRGEGVGVLLTGMGRDGAIGLKVLRDAGYHTIAQDQQTSAVYGMPKAAAHIGAAVEILPLDRIAPALAREFKPKVVPKPRLAFPAQTSHANGLEPNSPANNPPEP